MSIHVNPCQSMSIVIGGNLLQRLVLRLKSNFRFWIFPKGHVSFQGFMKQSSLICYEARKWQTLFSHERWITIKLVLCRWAMHGMPLKFPFLCSTLDWGTESRGHPAEFLQIQIYILRSCRRAARTAPSVLKGGRFRWCRQGHQGCSANNQPLGTTFPNSVQH